jgi:hypothetical protein
MADPTDIASAKFHSPGSWVTDDVWMSGLGLGLEAVGVELGEASPIPFHRTRAPNESRSYAGASRSSFFAQK